MAWNLHRRKLETFERNPLTAVIVQLQYDPILNVSAGVAAFQDVIRQRFTRYDSRNVRDINVDFAAGASGTPEVMIREGVQHRFSCRAEPTSVLLDEKSVSLEYLGSHKSRETLFADVELVFRAFFETYEHASLTRLGLRYVNSIRPEEIARDRGSDEAPPWHKLLHADFLQIPQGLADFDSTHSYHELTSELPPGQLTLRYGMPFSPQGQSDFRLDIDRYCMSELEGPDFGSMIETFADDIFSVFMAAAGEELLAWMREVRE